MPKSTHHHTISRQWEILKKLPARGPGITASVLTAYLHDTAEFTVTKRTVERDLIELAQQFGIRCNDESIPYGWHWLSGQQPIFGSIDLPEALSLVLAETTLKKLLPVSMLTALRPKFELARSKLAALENHRYARWADKVRYEPNTLSLTPPQVNERVLTAVQQALLDEQQIIVSYLAPDDRKSKKLTLHPLSLIQRGPVSYLVATAFDYTDIRLYAIHRIKSALLTPGKVTRPKNYNIDCYLASGAMEFANGKTIRLKAWVSNELGILLAETPLSPNQTIQTKQGRLSLTAKVTDSWQLRWWILSQGNGITVANPVSLKRKIQDQLRTTLANYES